MFTARFKFISPNADKQMTPVKVSAHANLAIIMSFVLIVSRLWKKIFNARPLNITVTMLKAKQV